MQKMNDLKIDPRKRWHKLYDRNPKFKSVQKLLSVEISNKVYQLRNVQPVVGPVKYRNVDCLLRRYETASRILIYRRCQVESHRECYFRRVCNKPGSSSDIDEVSGETLSHITLLCRDVICECNTCTTRTCTGGYLSCDTCSFNFFLSEPIPYPKSQLSGSFAEHCMLPTFYLQTDCSVKKWSDIDAMIYKGETVGFDVTESDIFATVDTDGSRPGYLRLRELGNRPIDCHARNSLTVEPGPTIGDIFFPNVDSRLSLKYSQHGPATIITNDTFGYTQFDFVPYFSCSSWPPMAKSWISRERSSNWPPKETIQTIVSKGCRIVHAPHELSEDKDAEFRFSFSEAELILFGTLSCDQRKCFVAFKALMKNSIYKLEYKTREDINLSSYCLKTIFLWACETIPVDHWQTTNGWSKCLLYMIDTLYACVKARHLSGYFIPESNLLDNFKQFGPLLDEIESLRSNPVSHAAIFINATECFYGFLSEIYGDTNILCSSDKVKEIVLIKQLIFLQRIVAKTKRDQRSLVLEKRSSAQNICKLVQTKYRRNRVCTVAVFDKRHDFVRCCLLRYCAWI